MNQPKPSDGEARPPAEAIATAQQLTTAVRELAERADALQGYGRRTRLATWGLGVSVAIDVIFSVVALWAIGQAQSASDAAEQTRQTQIQTCLATNTARAQNKQLWVYVLSVPPSRPLTGEERKRRADFRAYLDKVFVPRDCTRI